MNVSPKVTAGTSGVGLAGAATTVAVWVASAKYHIDIPPDVAVAIGTIISMIVGFFAAWLVANEPPPKA
jgi:hypothetical protein